MDLFGVEFGSVRTKSMSLGMVLEDSEEAIVDKDTSEETIIDKDPSEGALVDKDASITSWKWYWLF